MEGRRAAPGVYCLPMERRFPRRIDALDDVFAFLREFRESESIDEANGFNMDLVVEELFTNMVKYSPEGEDHIDIGLAREDGERLVVTMLDHGVESFDVTRSAEVDTENPKPLDEMKVGGLGLHLVKRMTDSVSYEYEDRTSRTTLVIRLEKPNADDHA